MKNINRKKAMIFVLAAVLTLLSAFPVLAETAKKTNGENGRTITVQELMLEDAEASASIIRGGAAIAPEAGVRLAEGDVLRTKGNAALCLSVDAQMVLRLGRDSEAVIEKASAGQQLGVKLQKGYIFYNVAKQAGNAESLEMTCSNINFSVRGTSGILTFGNGMAQHMLFDGAVTVSDGKTARTQNSGELSDINIGPGYTLESGVTGKNFILSELPVTAVEEMKKDAGLMARVLVSVPVSIDADGTKKYADASWFTENVQGIPDLEVFHKSLRFITGTSSSGSSDPDPAVCPYADGSRGGELYYILEEKTGDEYKTFIYRYSSSSGTFEFRDLTNFCTDRNDFHAGDWVHYHIINGFAGFCTGDGDGAYIPEIYTVSFDMNGQTVRYPPQDREVPEGKTVIKPGGNFDTNCCTFDGWYTEPECVTAWDFDNDVVTEDLTLYAHWLPKTMKIWMQAGAGGTGGPEYVNLTYGECLEPLASLPTHSTKSFLGYFTLYDEKIYDETGSPVDGAEDLIWSKYNGLTVYAKWDYEN